MTTVAPPLAFYRGPWSGVKREGLGLGSLACELPPWGIGTSTFTILATCVILTSWGMFFIGIIGWGASVTSSDLVYSVYTSAATPMRT